MTMGVTAVAPAAQTATASAAAPTTATTTGPATTTAAATATPTAPAGPIEGSGADTGADDPEPAAGPAGRARLLPGPPTVSRRAAFGLANLCTLSSLSLGVLAILLAMRGEVRTAAMCLIACVVCDGLDGLLARRMGVTSPFGAQMDSLADMCAFGVAAPVVLYASLVGSVPQPAAATACALVAVCAAIRLARFNVSRHDSRFFAGVPTTATAAVLALAVLIGLPLPPAVQLGGMTLLAFAMVSSFPYASLARLARLPALLWLAPLAGAFVDPQVTFLVLVGAYLASGPVLWLCRVTASVRSG